MSRISLPPGEKKYAIQFLVKRKDIDVLGGEEAIRTLCRAHIISKAFDARQKLEQKQNENA